MQVWQDLRFGFRMLAKSPGFTSVALVTLALGIGANTTIFSIVNSVLLEPLPYEHPERIVQVAETIPAARGYITSSLPKFNLFRDHARSFSAVTAVSPAGFQINGPATAPPVFVIGARVSGGFFRVFGAQPARGRAFTAGEDQPGAAPVAVISDSFWRTRFGGDPGAIGSSIGVQGVATTVVGVMPAGFQFPDTSEIWIPRIFEHTVITPIQIQRGASYLLLYGRLADGAAEPAAEAELASLSRQYDASHAGFGDLNRPVHVTPLRDSLVSDVRQTLLVLLGAVAFVLLIASANVANLLLARAVQRRKEVAVRSALGAGRARLIAQFLTESLLLSLFGAALGLLLAFWGLRLVGRLGPDVLPRISEIHLDSTVLVFTIAIAAATGILFGLGPALQAAKPDLNDVLRATGRGISGGGKLRGLLIASEVALAVVLLTGAGLLLRSFLNLQSVDPGFRPGGLLTMHIGLAGSRYPDAQHRNAFFDRAIEEISAIPGVGDVALSNALPIAGRAIGYFFNIAGRPVLEPTKAPTFWLATVNPGYFRTLGIPLAAGRNFTEADTATSPLVGIINQTMARRFWPGEDPIGKHVIYARESIDLEIVGIAADVKIGGLGDNQPYNQMYVPYRQRPFLSVWLIAQGPSSAASGMRGAISKIDADQPPGEVRTMNDAIANSVTQPRLRTALIAAFASLALILALIGIGGVVAWSVSQRTNEIGIRMALGARPSDIVAMILRQAFMMIGAGQLAGLIGALALTRILASFLFGISPEDPATFLAVLLALSLVALAACAFAARRALRIDPVVALRLE